MTPAQGARPALALCFLPAFLLAAVLCSSVSTVAAEPCAGIVFRPVAAAGVKDRQMAQIVKALAKAIEREPTLTWAPNDALAEVANPSECVRDAQCLAKAAASSTQTCALGILVQKGSKHGHIAMHLLAVDIGQAKVLGDNPYNLKKAHLGTASSDSLDVFWLMLPEPATRVEAPVEVLSTVSRALPQPKAAQTSSESSASPSVAGERLRYVELSGGSLLPRGQLKLGALVGVNVSIPLSKSAPIALRIGFDWSQLVKGKTTFLMPSNYPSGQANLIQRSRIYGMHVGVGVRLARLGFVDLDADAAVGATLNDSNFQAYNMNRQERGFGPLFVGNLAAVGNLGPALWLLKLGWRESWHSLGDSGKFGENVVSGFQASLGVGVPL